MLRLCHHPERRTVNEGVATLACDVADNRLKATEVSRVESPSQPCRRGAHALHQERNAERVEALADEVVDRGWGRPRVVLAELPGDDGVPELGPRLVHAEVRELGARTWAERGRGRGRGRGRRCTAWLALGVVCGE